MAQTNVAFDLRSPFSVSGLTGSHSDIGTANSNYVPNQPGVSPFRMTVPQNGPADIGGGRGIAPPKNPNPNPGDISIVGFVPPVQPIPGDPSNPSDPGNGTPGSGSDSPLDKLIGIVAAQMAGNAAGGPVALPATVTTDSGSGNGAIAVVGLLAIVGGVVWWTHRKKKGSTETAK